MVKSTPYAGAQSGGAVGTPDEITKILLRFGCENVGFTDDFEKHEVLLTFTHRGRRVQLRASVKGWAQMYLRENPWDPNRHKVEKQEYERQVLSEGQIGMTSFLRDWITHPVFESNRSGVEKQVAEVLDLELVEAGDCIDPVPAIIEPNRNPDFPSNHEIAQPPFSRVAVA
jgi:hypothetical protein